MFIEDKLAIYYFTEINKQMSKSQKNINCQLLLNENLPAYLESVRERKSFKLKKMRLNKEGNN